MEPEQLNVVGIETRWGYKTFHLYRGDITRMDHPVDVLVTSVFQGEYSPLEGTVVRSIQDRFGLSVADLEADPEWDLRPTFGCWISRPTGTAPFERLVCVELSGDPDAVGESIENLLVGLSVMEGKGQSVRIVASPLLGAGSLGLDPSVVMEPLLTRALEFMHRSPSLERILFVEIDFERAGLLDEGMNSVLGRAKVTVPKGELIQNLASELMAMLDRAASVRSETENGSLLELRRVMGRDVLQSFEVGVGLRRVLEHIVGDLSPGGKFASLYKGIEGLHEEGVAKWIISYLHVLRVFGNEAAHEAKGSRVPPHVDESDLAICLFCANRVLGFWLDRSETQGSSAGRHGA